VDYAHSECGSKSASTHKAAADDPREYSVRATVIVEDPKKPGHVKGVMAVPVEISGGRVVDGSAAEKMYPAQLVLVALGFTGPEPLAGVSLDKRGNFDGAYGEYKMEAFENVFAAGDCRRGASLVVTAIAEGRDCANRVDEYLNGDTTLPRTAPLLQNPSLYTPAKKHPGKKQVVSAGNTVENEYARGLVGEPSRQPRKIIKPLAHR
jgi:hypothetical protein